MSLSQSQAGFPQRRSGFQGYHLVALILAGIVAQLFIVLYWSLWPYDVFYFTEPLKVDQSAVIRAGGTLKYEMSYCKNARYNNYAAQVQILYINHQIIYTPSWVQFLEPGCRTEYIYTTVPELPPGKYKLVLYREYQINPIRTLRYNTESDYFEVKEKER